MNNNVFSKNLKNLLIKNNMSQSFLAKELDIKLSNINKYVKGITIPRQENLEKISNYFQVSKSSILGFDENENTSNKNIIIEDYFKLSYLKNNDKHNIYVPMKYRKIKDRLTAIEINDSSMNNTFNLGDILVIEKIDPFILKNNDIVAILHNEKIKIRKIFIDTINNLCALIADNHKMFETIIININSYKEKTKIIGKVIWHVNSDDISKKY